MIDKRVLLQTLDIVGFKRIKYSSIMGGETI